MDAMHAPPSGKLYVISAPSGAGKSTLVLRLLARVPELAYSISHTTRSPRGAERDGEDYHFVSVPEFTRIRDTGGFAEWARVHDNFYGTSKERLEAFLKAGKSVVLDIDVQGARQVLGHYPEAVTIFVKPPSLEELERRLKNRGTDSPETIKKRRRNAEGEMAQEHLYRHVLVNDDLDRATDELTGIIRGYEEARIQG